MNMPQATTPRAKVDAVIDGLRNEGLHARAEERALVATAIESLPWGFGELEAALQHYAETLEDECFEFTNYSREDVAGEIDRLSQGL
jgi:hypothetical protein